LVWQNCYYTIEFVPAESPLECMAQCSVFQSVSVWCLWISKQNL